MNSVSPLNTTLWSPSCMNQQMLSCVWHGVCSAVTSMAPILSFSSCPGVRVTPSHFVPPQMGSFSLMASRCVGVSLDARDEDGSGCQVRTISVLPPAWSW